MVTQQRGPQNSSANKDTEKCLSTGLFWGVLHIFFHSFWQQDTRPWSRRASSRPVANGPEAHLPLIWQILIKHIPSARLCAGLLAKDIYAKILGAEKHAMNFHALS
jgi:hypothetical protein